MTRVTVARTALSLMLAAAFPIAAQPADGPSSTTLADTNWAREEPPRPADPNRTRYLFGQSAFMARQGEVSVSLTELVLPQVSVGLTDYLSAQVGTVWPYDVFPLIGGNVTAGVKVGAPLAERWSLAATANVFAAPLLGSVTHFQSMLLGSVAGLVTYGTPDAHLTFSAGVPFTVPPAQASLANSYASLSGDLRVGSGIALLTETWFSPGAADGAPVVLSSGAARFFGEHYAVDAGLVLIITTSAALPTMPVPWLSVAWNF